MQLQNDKVVMDKELFLINCLATGLACQCLAEISNRKLNNWMEYLTQKAEEQYDQMSREQRENMINAYMLASQEL